ncbi:MAG TPA: ABC transporter permease [Candidatus Hydrogenedens sp.]|nr:ABC transporter permease [Candidatus Hydrogenedens sp.]HOK08312.1 ABC transporter permease [Candidatus Hydrogenedens sp.]HOL18894.1 ABC transporter permease [Candidatus Hydrogenedens sp.]HPP57606.1 ABC transporter permease [Candidatus Hydrogenedens sp.]
MLQGFFAIVYKETRHIVRDPRSLFLMLVIPGLELVIFGFAVNLDIKNIKTGVLNQDKRIESRNLLDQFVNSGYFDIVYICNSEEEMASALRRGYIRVGIHIPPYYTDRILKNEHVDVQILIDGSDSTVAMQALNVSNAIGLRASIKILSKTNSLPSQFPIDMRPRVLFNPDMRTANFMIPGLIGVILQVIVMLLTSFAVVREKEQRTLEQLVVTPVSRFGLMLGKLVPFLGVGICETISVLFLMRFLFQVPIAGSLLLLSFFAIIFLFTTLGMGLLVSTFSQNQIQALQISFVILLPSFLLSGFMFPQETMPRVIYWIGQVVPATYFIRILRGIILRNAGFWDLWHNGAILGIMGIIIIVIASFRFHKTVG